MSLDVVSMFTNVLTELVVSLVEKGLHEVDLTEYMPLPKDTIVSVLRLCFSFVTREAIR